MADREGIEWSAWVLREHGRVRLRSILAGVGVLGLCMACGNEDGGGGSPESGLDAGAAGGASNGGAATGGGASSGGRSGTGGGAGGVAEGGGSGGAVGAGSQAGAGGAGAGGAPPALPESALVYVGSGDFGGGNGAITLFRLDYASATLTRVDSVASGGLQSFLAVDPVVGALYAVDEAEGSLRRFSLDPTTGLPESPAAVGSAGHPVHVTTTRDGRFVLLAHYNEGQAESFGVQGRVLGASIDVETPGAQAHAIVLSPDERFAFVPCKGSDHVARFSFDGTSGQLTELSPPIPTEPGDGPRHLAFHPSGEHAYVLTELSSKVIVYSYAAGGGGLTQLERVDALPPAFGRPSTGAEIALLPSGAALYSSNRVSGADGTLAAFRVGADGRLTPLGHASTGGRTPRSFAVDPSGRFVLVANQDSGTVAVLPIDPDTFALGEAAVTDVGVTPYFVGVVLPP